MIRCARNSRNVANGVSEYSVVTALDLANELDVRFKSSVGAGTGVTVTETQFDPDGPEEGEDPITRLTISIGQEVNTTSDVTFNSVYATNDVTAFSDVRGKDNIIDLDESLDKIESLRGVKYNLKSDPDRERIGVIAQEVVDIVPEVVNYDESEDRYSVSYMSLVPLLIEAVKELSARVKKLEGSND